MCYVWIPLLVFTLISCSSNKAGKQTKRFVNSNIEITIELNYNQKAIQCLYSVKNVSGKTLWVCNGRPVETLNFFNINYNSSQKLLEQKIGNIVVPSSVFLEAVCYSGFTELLPGEVFRNEVVCQFPIKDCCFNVDNVKLSLKDVEKYLFSLEYYLDLPKDNDNHMINEKEIMVSYLYGKKHPGELIAVLFNL